MPYFPLKTALLLAYMKGNGGLCRALVKCGAVALGNLNNAGVSIFNCAVASKVVFLYRFRGVDHLLEIKLIFTFPNFSLKGATLQATGLS